jgi:hypothetical protein
VMPVEGGTESLAVQQEVCSCRGGVSGFEGLAHEAQCSVQALMRRLQFKVPGYEPVLLALTHGWGTGKGSS